MISICIKINNDKILDYLINEIKKSTISEITCRRREFKVFQNVIIHYQGNAPENFYNFLSNVLASTIVKFFEGNLIKDLIDLNYFYFTEQDKKVIFEEYKLLLKKKLQLTDYNHKSLYYDLIYDCVKDYIVNNKSLVLTGFVNFRLKKYIENLEDLVSEAVNQYVIDKEYIKFVDLLSNYVSSRIPNNLILHLIYVNSEGILLTNEGEIVKLEEFNSAYLSDISFSKNDYILNTLVGLLPSKIMVHLISPKDQFIKTIELIFENKVEVCQGCELCRAYELLNLH